MMCSTLKFVTFLGTLCFLSEGEAAGLPNITAVLETIRQNMGEPQPKLGLPALDPYFNSHLALNLDQDMIKLDVSIDNLTVTKLSTFEAQIPPVGLTLSLITIVFNFSLPELDLTGNYDVTGDLAGEDGIHVYGNGPFSITVGDLWVSGTIEASYIPTVTIKNVTVDYYLGYADIHLSGLMGGGKLGDVFNGVLSDMVPKLAVYYKADISQYLTNLLFEKASELVNEKTLKQILDSLQ